MTNHLKREQVKQTLLLSCPAHPGVHPSQYFQQVLSFLFHLLLVPLKMWLSPNILTIFALLCNLLLIKLIKKLLETKKWIILTIRNSPIIGERSSGTRSLREMFKSSERNVELCGFESCELLSGTSSKEPCGKSLSREDKHRDMDLIVESTWLVLHGVLPHTEQEDIDFEE